jgi:hypothetical protein
MSAQTRLHAIAWALLGLLAACGDDGATTDNPASMAQPLTCAAGQPRPCPCVGQGMGMQMCNVQGNGYGACTGCPAPAGQGGASGSGVRAGAGAGGTAMAASGAGAVSGGGGASGQGGAGAGGAGAGGRAGSGGAGGADEPSPTADAEPGTSCGVGLPTLCELMTEKCCMRSLETDTCIEASAMCSCTIQGCTVMEARCDGPEDCPSGQVCCGTLAGNTYDEFTCAATCQSNGQQRVACHESDPKCPSGLICANSQLLTNVQVCIDPASIEQ